MLRISNRVVNMQFTDKQRRSTQHQVNSFSMAKVKVRVWVSFDLGIS